MTSTPAWKLNNFDEWLTRWQNQENPSPDLCFTIICSLSWP